MSGKVTKTLFERFHSKWTPHEPSSCWLWTSSNAKFKYGKITLNGRHEMATRVSWMLHYGEMPPKHLDVCHHCDTPACVNPNHLFLGTARDNHMDSVRKGRRPRGYGKDWNKVRDRKEIRKLFCNNGHPLSGENLYISPKGWAGCKECRRQQVYACKRRKGQ